MFKCIVIDSEYNKLLCNTNLVGKGELVEIHSLDEDTPPQATGKVLQKISDPNYFIVHNGYDIDADGLKYKIGEKCILRVLSKNKSGSRKRRFSKDEKIIVNIESGPNFKEKKIIKAKTGSVRKKVKH